MKLDASVRPCEHEVRARRTSNGERPAVFPQGGTGVGEGGRRVGRRSEHGRDVGEGYGYRMGPALGPARTLDQSPDPPQRAEREDMETAGGARNPVGYRLAADLCMSWKHRRGKGEGPRRWQRKRLSSGPRYGRPVAEQRYQAAGNQRPAKPSMTVALRTRCLPSVHGQV